MTGYIRSTRGLARSAPKMSPSPRSSVTAATSRRMARTRGFDNPRERAIRSQLHRMGLRFRIHFRAVPGTTRTIDIAFTRLRLAVFCDGCFWHGCPQHATQSKTNAEWWQHKITANISRDRDTDARLCASGWSVLRIWEHEPGDRAVAAIVDRLDKLAMTGGIEIGHVIGSRPATVRTDQCPIGQYLAIQPLREDRD
ncbi:DNA mismatch endonuclease Vsr [compost metagenome]